MCLLLEIAELNIKILMQFCVHDDKLDFWADN